MSETVYKVDLFAACEILAKRLMVDEYISIKPLGAGFNFITHCRDFDYEVGKNKLTKEIAQDHCPPGYTVMDVRYFTTDKGTEYVNISVKDNNTIKTPSCDLTDSCTGSQEEFIDDYEEGDEDPVMYEESEE